MRNIIAWLYANYNDIVDAYYDECKHKSENGIKYTIINKILLFCEDESECKCEFEYKFLLKYMKRYKYKLIITYIRETKKYNYTILKNICGFCGNHGSDETIIKSLAGLKNYLNTK